MTVTGPTRELVATYQRRYSKARWGRQTVDLSGFKLAIYEVTSEHDIFDYIMALEQAYKEATQE